MLVFAFSTSVFFRSPLKVKSCKFKVLTCVGPWVWLQMHLLPWLCNPVTGLCCLEGFTGKGLISCDIVAFVLAQVQYRFLTSLPLRTEDCNPNFSITNFTKTHSRSLSQLVIWPFCPLCSNIRGAACIVSKKTTWTSNFRKLRNSNLHVWPHNKRLIHKMTENIFPTCKVLTNPLDNKPASVE